MSSWHRRQCLTWGALLAMVAIVIRVPHLRADERLYSARVFLDRAVPERSVSVVDFRVAAGPSDEHGGQHIVLYSPDGAFQVSFDAISEIDINRPLGRSGDVARYEATVKLKQERDSRTGRLDLHLLSGIVDALPWHVLLTARADRGANLHRIVFAE